MKYRFHICGLFVAVLACIPTLPLTRAAGQQPAGIQLQSVIHSNEESLSLGSSPQQDSHRELRKRRTVFSDFSPDEGNVVTSSSFTFEATITDSRGIRDVSFEIYDENSDDYITVSAEETNDLFSAVVSNLDDGDYQWRAIASVGNGRRTGTSEWISLEVQAENKGPSPTQRPTTFTTAQPTTVSIPDGSGSTSFEVDGTSFTNLSPSEGSNMDSSSILFEATVTNPDKDVRRVFFEVFGENGRSLGSFRASQNGNEYSLLLNGFDGGIYSWKIYAKLRRQSTESPRVDFTVQGNGVEPTPSPTNPPTTVAITQTPTQSPTGDVSGPGPNFSMAPTNRPTDRPTAGSCSVAFSIGRTTVQDLNPCENAVIASTSYTFAARVDGKRIRDVFFEIYDENGNSIGGEHEAFLDGEFYTIDVESLEPGSYTWQVIVKIGKRYKIVEFPLIPFEVLPGDIDPTPVPTAPPTNTVTETPTASPTTPSPTAQPSNPPSGLPSVSPTPGPSAGPSSQPTVGPSQAPTSTPTAAPSVQPTSGPTQEPTPVPSQAPTLPGATFSPTSPPSAQPSGAPTTNPSASPTVEPTTGPTSGPTPSPTQNPTPSPSLQPTPVPTDTATASDPIVYGLQPNCNDNDPTRFNICLDLVSVSGNRESWMDGFQVARDRWEELITGDDGLGPLDSSSISLDADEIGTALPAAIDDLYISGFERVIDGPFGTVGRAGPTVIKSVGGNLQTWTGFMEFDQADILDLEASGLWSRVVLHEMAHVLGFGTLWELNGVYDGEDTGSDVFRGPAANAEWDALGCTGVLPVELDGGEGTAGGHWDEECLVDEIMTGTFFGNGPSYLSRLTVAAFADIGYTVDLDAADAFDITLLGTCGSYCPGARRNLRRAGKKRTPISEDGLKRIYNDAYETLKEKRRNPPASIPEDHIFVGGNIITIWIRDDDGELKERTVTWTETEAFVEQEKLKEESESDNVFDH